MSLKHGPNGHLLHGPNGHLVHECGSGGSGGSGGVFGRFVFFQMSQNDYGVHHYYLLAVDIADGTLLWEQEVPRDYLDHTVTSNAHYSLRWELTLGQVNSTVILEKRSKEDGSLLASLDLDSIVEADYPSAALAKRYDPRAGIIGDAEFIYCFVRVTEDLGLDEDGYPTGSVYMVVVKLDAVSLAKVATLHSANSSEPGWFNNFVDRNDTQPFGYIRKTDGLLFAHINGGGVNRVQAIDPITLDTQRDKEFSFGHLVNTYGSNGGIIGQHIEYVDPITGTVIAADGFGALGLSGINAVRDSSPGAAHAALYALPIYGGLEGGGMLLSQNARILAYDRRYYAGGGLIYQAIIILNPGTLQKEYHVPLGAIFTDPVTHFGKSAAVSSTDIVMDLKKDIYQSEVEIARVVIDENFPDVVWRKNLTDIAPHGFPGKPFISSRLVLDAPGHGHMPGENVSDY